MKKQIVRKHIQDILQTIQPEERRVKSESITEKLFRTAWWHEAEIILAFCSMQEEVETEEIINAALETTKIVGVPRMQGDDLVFHRIRDLEEDFCLNCFGIKEPDVSWPVLDLSQLPSRKFLIVTPGLAFDRKKHRLGRGKGFYDRLLLNLRTCHEQHISAVGVCFSEQLLEHVPARAHDQPVDAVITEEEIIV
jgi:5-formyltetrahydrofolate cyclo-ligase